MLSIIAGCYEEQVLGYVIKFVDGSFKAERKFCEHSHSGCVKCVTSGPQYIASGSIDEAICIYDIESNTEVCILQGHIGTINALSFANDGTLVSCSDDGNICIWEVGEPACLLKTLKGHKGPVSSISIHPSGKLAMSTSLKDGTVRTWNLLAGRSLYVKNMKSTINAELVRWSSDGTKFMLVSKSKISIYNLETTKCCMEYSLNSPVLTTEYLPGYDIFATGDVKGCICLYDVSQSNYIHKFQAHDARIKSLYPFVPPKEFEQTTSSEVWIVSASSDESLKIWKLTIKSDVLIQEELLTEISTGARLTSVSVWYPGMITSYGKKSTLLSKIRSSVEQQKSISLKKSVEKKIGLPEPISKEVQPTTTGQATPEQPCNLAKKSQKCPSDENIQENRTAKMSVNDKKQKRKGNGKSQVKTPKKSKLNIADLL